MDAYRAAQAGAGTAQAEAAALCRRLEQAMQAQLDAVPPPDRAAAHAEPNGTGGLRFWFAWRAA